MKKITANCPVNLSEEPIEELARKLEDSCAEGRKEVLRALEGSRGPKVLRLLDTVTDDPDPEVRKLADWTRKQVRENTAMFGKAKLPRTEIPPLLPTPAQVRRTNRLVWAAWAIGCVAALAAAIGRDTTILMLPSSIGSFLLTVTIVLFVIRLLRAPRSHGWITLDTSKKQIFIEVRKTIGFKSRTIIPFSLVKGLRLEEKELLTPGGNAAATNYELSLEVEGGDPILFARREDIVDAGRLAKRLALIIPMHGAD